MKHERALKKVCDVKRVRALIAQKAAGSATQVVRESQAALVAVSQERQGYEQALKASLEDFSSLQRPGRGGIPTARALSEEYHHLQDMIEQASIRETDLAHSLGDVSATQQATQKHALTTRASLDRIENLLAKQSKVAETAAEIRSDDEITGLFTSRKNAYDA